VIKGDFFEGGLDSPNQYLSLIDNDLGRYSFSEYLNRPLEKVCDMIT